MSGELFVEVFCEELPADAVRPAVEGLRSGLLGLLDGLAVGKITTYCTPRRLAVQIDDVPAGTPKEEKLVTGPPAERAFDADGKPTKAALGFARGKGADASALEVVDTDKGKMVGVRVVEGGESTASMVAAGLDGVVRGIPFARSMEWGDGGVKFGRPLHLISALYDGETIACEAAGITVGNASEGHRLADDRAFSFSSCDEWLTQLRDRHVEPDADVRKATIVEQLAALAKEHGFDPIDDDELLEEVTFLVEWPIAIRGAFDDDLLVLPPRLLVESMKVHQRYFPITRDGALTNEFGIVSNNPWGNAELIAEGNARVLRARFFDAKFFLAEDEKMPLSAHGERLGDMRWIRGLGTVSEKQGRIADIAASLTSDEFAIEARRAGTLCKADLATQMVGEFPELQGHVGNLYAGHHGESEAVATAIEEHYLPRFAGDEMPQTPVGVALAMADRLDTLVGCFGIGLVPKGGGDPQGLRRAALGLVNIVISCGLRVDLHALFGTAVTIVHSAACKADKGFEAWTKARGSNSASPTGREELIDQLVEFAYARFKAAQVSDGCSSDIVDAVIAASEPDPLVLQRKVDALRELARTDAFVPIMITCKRVLNITKGADDPPPDPSSFTEDVEHTLNTAIDAVADDVAAASTRLEYGDALRHALTLEPHVAKFFDDVIVEDPDPVKKAVRRGLLRRVSALFLHIADLTRISTR